MVATLADAATADILYGTRSQKISVTAANEGMWKDFTVTPGDEWILFAIVKSDGSNDADVRIYDQDNTANIVTYTTTSSSYALLTGSFEVPAGCTTIRVFVESGSAASYDMHIAQLQILPNKVVNGSMEGTYVDQSGGGGGTIDLAPGWNNRRCETDGSDELSEENVIVHSGGASQKMIIDVAEGVASAATLVVGKWYLMTFWMYGDGSSPFRVVNHTELFLNETFVPPASWKKYSFVFTPNITNGTFYFIGGSGVSNKTFYLDDASLIALDDVSITATAANAANSAEGTGIRVDGLDTLTQAPSFTKAGWKIKWPGSPRHEPADMLKFGNSEVYLFEWYVDANNYIRIFADTANQLDMTFNANGGGEQSGNGDVTALWTADEALEFELQASATDLIFRVGGVDKITITQPAVFANAPDENIYFGSDRNGAKQFDMVLG